MDVLMCTFTITAALTLEDTSLCSPSSYWSTGHPTRSAHASHALVFSDMNCGLNPSPVRPLETLFLSAVEFRKHLMQSDFILLVCLFSNIIKMFRRRIELAHQRTVLRYRKQHLLVIILLNCLCAIQSVVLFLLLAGWLLSFVHIQFPQSVFLRRAIVVPKLRRNKQGIPNASNNAFSVLAPFLGKSADGVAACFRGFIPCTHP